MSEEFNKYDYYGGVESPSCPNVDKRAELIEELSKILKDLLLTPKKLDKKPTIAELEKILNSEEGSSIAMAENGEIFCARPKFSIEDIAKEISTFILARDRKNAEVGYKYREEYFNHASEWTCVNPLLTGLDATLTNLGVESKENNEK